MISLVTTVLNDKDGCINFVRQIEAQTLLPQEIVIVDGGSKDGTWEFLQTYSPKQPLSLRVLQDIGCNVARGRNIAIEQASNDFIVSTDVGCSWEPEWLEELARPLLDDGKIEAVMGSWKVRWQDLRSIWSKVEYIYLHGPQMIADKRSSASSRSIAYRKTLWQRIGGYPEDLTLAGDDMVFALLLHRTTNKTTGVSTPRCYWERPNTLRAFCKEARRNFKGAGEAGIWLKHGLLVSARLLVELTLLLFSIVLLVLKSPLWSVLLCLVLLIVLIGTRLKRLLPAFQRAKNHNIPHAVFRILSFEYLTKFWGVVGYWEGFGRGFKHCENCRERLRLAGVSRW